jgi:dihydrolipoamide dehydrogenase
MSFDLVVIGTGPGGYVCAIRAAQLGMKVAVVEKDETFGGTCLNVGCIPSKALLTASESYEEVAHRFVQMGIKSSGRELDLSAMMAFKDQGVDGNVKGVAFLFRKNKIDTIHGHGRIVAPGQIEVKANGTSQRLDTKAIVIATGSDVARLNGIAIDQQRIVDSTGALKLAAVPRRLLVIGAGVIGLELGSVWRRLGAEVIVVEFLDRVLAGMDGELGRQAQRIFQRQGMTFRLAQKVTAIDTAGPRLSAKVEPTGGGASESIEVDVALVAIGRVPYTEGLGLDEVGVQRDNRGRVMVDAQLATNVAGIYAIGDVIAGPMLAHKAQDEGVAVAERLAGKAGHVNYDVIPNVVYTYPEIASVGKSEEELKEAGIEYRTGKFPFTANGRAKASLTTEGFVKILADARNDRVLGVHIMGADAGNMIAEAAVAMEFGAAAEDIARTCHAHPTLTEAVKEAALAVDGRAIHL